MRSLCRIVFLLGLTFISMKCSAQTAAIAGQIQDASGAVIRGAEIRIVEQSQGTSRTIRTNNAGTYSAPFLNPGSYRVYVQAPSFSTAASEPLMLTVGQTLVFNVTLQVGGAQQEVTVDSGSSLLNTTDASVSTVVDQKFVKNMPLNGRSFQDLISMTPGVTTQSSQAGGSIQYQGDFSVNGQRTESNYYMVDGVSGNVAAGYPNGSAQNATGGSIAGSTALGTTQSLVSVDALQEFRVTSSTYSAEYGRNPGGQFSLLTRSGTNTIHGSVFDYLRNDVFDANDWFNNHNAVRKPALRQNDFGGTLGTPVIIPHLYAGRDRTFFFLSYEGLRLDQPTAATTQYVPSLAVRSAAPSAMQTILNAFPLPTGNEILTSTGALSGLSPFVKAFSLPGTIDSTSVRVDQKVARQGNVFFRYAISPTSTESRTLSRLFQQSSNTSTYTAGLDLSLTGRASTSLRFGYARSTASNLGTLDNFGGAVPQDFQEVLGVPGSFSTYNYYPYISISGVGSAYISQYNASNQFSQWNLTDTISLSLGKHQLKAGIDERHFDTALNPPQMSVQPYFYTRASMVNNLATSVSVARSTTADPTFQEFAAFLQDDWRVIPSLSVSGGIRWEVNPPPTAGAGQLAYTVIGDPHSPSTLTLAPKGTALWNTSWYNFAPRLGVAWTPHSQAGHETVVRAGGGVFYDTGSQVAAAGFSGLGFRKTLSYSNASLPLNQNAYAFTTDVSAPYTASSVYAYPRHMQLPYTLQWNLSLDQSFGRSQVLTMSYVGSSGRRLLQSQYLSVASQNPNFGAIYYYPNGVTSSYNGLQLKFQRSVTRGLQSLVSYTWSHSLDYGSTNATLPMTYGNSDFDVRHNLQGGLSWDIPTAFHNRAAQVLAGGWGVDGRLNIRSGFPINLTGSLLLDPFGNEYYSGVNYNPANPIYLYGSQYPGGRAINGGPKVISSSAAFTLPTGSARGNAARNFVRAFGADQINFALRREFHISEPLVIAFRAEAFNILNHPNFGYIDPTLTDAQFGTTTKMLNSSLGSMSSLYQQGGARSMQFSLRMSF